MHSHWSRISSYVAMFASHRVITVVSSGANCEAKLCTVEEKLTPKPCIEVSYFWIKHFKVRFDCFDCFCGCKSLLFLSLPLLSCLADRFRQSNLFNGRVKTSM